MKHILLGLSLLSISMAANAQVVYTNTVDFNNARAYVSNNGTFFRNYTNQMAGYSVPKSSGHTAIYLMNMAMSGTDINGQLKSALSTYDSSDFQPGPIAINYNGSAYQSRFGVSLWYMSRQEINDHISMWNQQGYTPPANILEWPGNGNLSNGEAGILAPYYDANGNGLYDPMQGDYPIIRGDYAIYSIVNDDKIHPSGADRIGMEMHLMVYQYADSIESINSTTFVHARLFNRGTQTLYNFHVGSFIDYDLGNYSDDYVGCDPGRNLSYCYNGDQFDEPIAGQPGYGENPPAIGVRYLNQTLNNHFSFSNQAGIDPNPNSPNQMEHIFNGYNQYGAQITDPDGQPTTFMYNDISDNGWNEFTPAANPPGDRRTIISCTPFTLQPYSDFCVDFAVVYATNTDSTIRGGVEHLLDISDEIQDFYDTQSYACNDASLGIGVQVAPVVNIYPNPATSVLHIEGTTGIPFRILSTDGKIVASGTGMETIINIDQLQAGYYIFLNEKGSKASFVKQ